MAEVEVNNTQPNGDNSNILLDGNNTQQAEHSIQPDEEGIIQQEEDNIQPETELHDIQSLTNLVMSKIQENENITSNVLEQFQDILLKIGDVTANNSRIKEAMESIACLTEEQNLLNARQVDETPEGVDTSESETLYDGKLSESALHCLHNPEHEGPLDPPTFNNFLLDKSFGKPRPPVLPIIRGYITSDIRERYLRDDMYGNDHDIVRKIMEQLKNFKLKLKRSHVNYMEDHKKDQNLERRIDRLVKNIKNELDIEKDSGMSQSSMRNFVTVTKKRRHTKDD